jgi:hypothetical protein
MKCPKQGYILLAYLLFWIYLAQDRDQKHDVVDMVMNLWAPQISKNF